MSTKLWKIAHHTLTTFSLYLIKITIQGYHQHQWHFPSLLPCCWSKLTNTQLFSRLSHAVFQISLSCTTHAHKRTVSTRLIVTNAVPISRIFSSSWICLDGEKYLTSDWSGSDAVTLGKISHCNSNAWSNWWWHQM